MRNISWITDHRLAEVARFPMQSLWEQGFDADYFSKKSHAAVTAIPRRRVGLSGVYNSVHSGISSATYVVYYLIL